MTDFINEWTTEGWWTERRTPVDLNIEGDVGELVRRLLAFVRCDVLDLATTDIQAAADTLLSQQQEIEALRRTNVTLHKDWVSLDGEYRDFAKEKQREIEALLATKQALENGWGREVVSLRQEIERLREEVRFWKHPSGTSTTHSVPYSNASGAAQESGD